jgi:hypothetical protein
MVKGLKFGFLLLTFISGCNSQAQVKGRIECINEFVRAIKNSDSTKLYKLFDTASFFRVQDRETFSYILNYVNNQRKECQLKIIDSIVKVREVPVNSKEYIVPFCRGVNGEILYGNSFDLRFTFKEYENKNRISYIEITKYNKVLAPTDK